MQIELSQQEAATLMNFLKEFELFDDPAEGKIVLDIVAKVKPVANPV